MCPTRRPVTNLHRTDPGGSEGRFQGVSPTGPDRRAHLDAAPRAVARTPLPHHADAIVASVVRRGRIHAVPVGRLRVDADDPVWQGLARDVDGQGVGVGQLSGHERERQVPQDSLDHIVPADDGDRHEAARHDGLLGASVEAGVCAGAVSSDASPVGFEGLSGLHAGVSGLRLTACAHGAPVSADSLVGTMSERHGELGASTPW